MNTELDKNIEAFVNGLISHPHHQKALGDLISKATNAKKGRLINLIGPTGVGKTTLLEAFQAQYTQMIISSGDYIASDMPVVLVEAPCPGNNSQFNWKEFYREALKVMLEPLPDRQCEKEMRIRKGLNDSKTVGYDLRSSFVDTISIRRVKVFIIDEAQHMAIGSGPKQLKDLLDLVKNLANRSGTLFVLAGVYELVDFLNLSGQLGRRTKKIHFPRYNPRAIKEDARHFASIVATFENRMPFPCSPPLTTLYEDLYAGSLGCIGILKEWLDEAVRDVAKNKDNLLTQEHLERTVMQKEDLVIIYDELMYGEPKMKSSSNTLTQMKALLGFTAKQPTTKKAESAEGRFSPKSDNKKKLKPGEMAPRRFETGKRKR